MSRIVRSSLGPALSRMRGECTRPSVPMMKLTRTFELGSAMSSSGFGVAKGSGGSEASQLAPAVCNMAANSESCSAEAHTWRSRAAKDNDDDKAGRAEAEAMPTADARTTRSNEHNLLTCMSIPGSVVVMRTATHRIRVTKGQSTCQLESSVCN